MRRRSLMLGIVATLGLGAAVAAGCSSSDTATTPTTSTTTSTTTASGLPKNMAFDTPNGQVSLSLDGNLPPNWPAGFPIPSGATAAGSGSLGNTSKTGMVGVFSTAAAASDTFNFYKNNSSLTVSNPTSSGIASAFVGKVTLGGQYAGSVTVAGVGTTTLIIVVLTSGGAGSNGTVAPADTGHQRLRYRPGRVGDDHRNRQRCHQLSRRGITRDG